MCQNRKPVPPAAAPRRITNAACPRCDGPVYWCPRRWLFCGACPPAGRPTPAPARAARPAPTPNPH